MRKVNIGRAVTLNPDGREFLGYIITTMALEVYA
jgi:hypothetical protein